MAAAPADVLEANQDVLSAVSGKVLHVGTDAGQGQAMKACLQALNELEGA